MQDLWDQKGQEGISLLGSEGFVVEEDERGYEAGLND